MEYPSYSRPEAEIAQRYWPLEDTGARGVEVKRKAKDSPLCGFSLMSKTKKGGLAPELTLELGACP